MWADLWPLHHLMTTCFAKLKYGSQITSLTHWHTEKMSQKYWIIPVKPCSYSVVFKGVVLKMNFPRFYFSKQLIYLHAGWAWASMKWNHQRAPVSGSVATTPPGMHPPFQQQMYSHPGLTWPFVIICMPDMGGFDRSDIPLRSINIKLVSGWCESQSSLGESVYRCH